jgi:hypothetical protein
MSVDVFPAPDTSTDYYLKVAKGEVAGASVAHISGYNPTQASGAWEGVHSLSGAFPVLSSATTIRIKAGGNAADTAAGAGARQIQVEGLDETGDAISVSINTNGASASASTTETFSRVFRAYVNTTGTYDVANTGDIVIENTAGTTDLIQITANEGEAQFCSYTIPLGFTGYLLSARVESDASKAADFRLMTRGSVLNTVAPFEPNKLSHYWDGVVGAAPLKSVAPMLVLSALTDIYIEANGSVATEVSADMEILLVAN